MATQPDKDMLDALASFKKEPAPLLPASSRQMLPSSVDRAIHSLSHIDATSGGDKGVLDHHDFKLILDNYAKAQGLDMKGLTDIPTEDCLKAYVGKFGTTVVQAALQSVLHPKSEFATDNAKPLTPDEINTVISTVFPDRTSPELKRDLGLLTPTGSGGKHSEIDQSPANRSV
ncbi:MAG: hypothetical protein MRY32_04385 [Rickettsiales bacterium]|nr:hypothetical protein [Rickettsiales bacterium]